MLRCRDFKERYGSLDGLDVSIDGVDIPLFLSPLDIFAEIMLVLLRLLHRAFIRSFTVSTVQNTPGGGGYSIYPWVGRCGAAPHTLTLSKTNITDFPTLFKTEFRLLIPCLRHLINIRASKNFAVYRPRKDILFKTKIDISIP